MTGAVESHKCKAHTYVSDAIRKTTKRRDSAQKQAAGARSRPTIVPHEDANSNTVGSRRNEVKR